METWQLAMFVVGGMLLVAYFMRRSSRLGSEE
jgi:hypothetical protein